MSEKWRGDIGSVAGLDIAEWEVTALLVITTLELNANIHNVNCHVVIVVVKMTLGLKAPLFLFFVLHNNLKRTLPAKPDSLFLISRLLN